LICLGKCILVCNNNIWAHLQLEFGDSVLDSTVLSSQNLLDHYRPEQTCGLGLHHKGETAPKFRPSTQNLRLGRSRSPFHSSFAERLILEYATSFCTIKDPASHFSFFVRFSLCRMRRIVIDATRLELPFLGTRQTNLHIFLRRDKGDAFYTQAILGTRRLPFQGLGQTHDSLGDKAEMPGSDACSGAGIHPSHREAGNSRDGKTRHLLGRSYAYR
jgi:hypothetical protein